MKKLLFILLIFPLFYMCQSEKAEPYKEGDILKNDTLNIERIKIKTH